MMPKIDPMVDDKGENRRGLDHPGNRSPQIAQEFDQGWWFFRDFIGAELRQAPPGLFI
jgi:hypothetical protein